MRVLIVVLVVGCQRPPAAAVSNKLVATVDDRCTKPHEPHRARAGGLLDVGAIPDADDRCPLLPDECMAGYDYRDDDGCPDPPPPEIVFMVGSATLPPAANAVLDEVAKESQHLAAGARLVVIGEDGPGERAGLDRARATAVADALARRCVPRAVLVIEADVPMDIEGRDPPPNRAVIQTRGCK